MLFLYENNWKYLGFNEIIFPLCLVMAGAFALFCLVNLIVRDGLKTSAMVSLFLVVFFSYGHVYSLYMDHFHGHTGHGPLLTFTVLFYLALILPVFLYPKFRDVFVRYLGVLSVLLITVTILRFTGTGIHNFKEYLSNPNANAFANAYKNTASPAVPFDVKDHSDDPDIYYIILDSYSNSRALKEYYRFDNGAFISWLRKAGFVLPKNPWTNYCQTALSLGSSLNMDYLFNLTKVPDEKTNDDRSYMSKLIENSAVSRYLKSIGYTTVKFLYGYDITDAFKADVIISSAGDYFIHEFENELANTTLLISFKIFMESQGEIAAKSRRVMTMLEGLPMVATKIKSPKFVFVHILVPHPPFVFDKDGMTDKYINATESPGDEPSSELTRVYKEGYIGQIEFINNRIEQVIQQLIQNSSRPPVIILQADHGSGMTFFRQLKNTNIYDRFSILNAYYLPLGGSSVIYNGITPVNSFRMILNYYFGTNYSRLPERSFFSAFFSPYNFTEITDSLKKHNIDGPAR